MPQRSAAGVLAGGTTAQHQRICDELQLLLNQRGGSCELKPLCKAYKGRFGKPFLLPGGQGVKNLRAVIGEEPYRRYFEMQEQKLHLRREPSLDGSSWQSVHSSHGGGAAAAEGFGWRSFQAQSPASQVPTRITSNSQMALLLDTALGRVSAGGYIAIDIGPKKELAVAIPSKKDGDAEVFIVPWSLIRCPVLFSVLGSPHITKVVYDLYHLEVLLSDLGPIWYPGALVDLQLYAENEGMAFDAPMSTFMKSRGYKSTGTWPEPFVDFLTAYQNTRWGVEVILMHGVAIKSRLDYIMSGAYSDRHGERRVCYDPRRKAMSSNELVEAVNGSAAATKTRLTINQEVEPLFDLVPPGVMEDPQKWQDAAFSYSLIELVLDVGQRARAKLRGQREHTYLHSDESVLVDRHQLEQLTADLTIGHDNRAGIDGTLHRISVILDKERAKVIGATLRVGRHITGNVEFLRDSLSDDPHKVPSILVVGPPGTGKTTIIRELARLMSVDYLLEVLIIDTSNEIAGDGDIAHRSVGCARRLMVRSLDEQARVMMEGVQNHTPEVMIIDEIGRKQEVKAAQTIKERGCAVIGSAHGSFDSLLRNPELKGLLGGCTTVLLGDEMARKTNKGQKLQLKREHAAIFDIVVELRREKRNEWRIYKDVATIVDAIYAGKPYTIECRSRDDQTGQLYLRKERGNIVYDEDSI